MVEHATKNICCIENQGLNQITQSKLQVVSLKDEPSFSLKELQKALLTKKVNSKKKKK